MWCLAISPTWYITTLPLQKKIMWSIKVNKDGSLRVVVFENVNATPGNHTQESNSKASFYRFPWGLRPSTTLDIKPSNIFVCHKMQSDDPKKLKLKLTDCSLSAGVMYKTGDLGNVTSISKPKVDEGCSFASQLMRSWKSMGNAFPVHLFLVVNNCNGFRSRVIAHPWWCAVSHPQKAFRDIFQWLTDDFYSLLKWPEKSSAGPVSSERHLPQRSRNLWGPYRDKKHKTPDEGESRKPSSFSSGESSWEELISHWTGFLPYSLQKSLIERRNELAWISKILKTILIQLL